MGSPGVGGTISAASDVLLSSPQDNDLLKRQGGFWKNIPGGGGVPTTYALGRVRYSAGWPGSRPSGYAFIDWIKSSTTDPDPASGLMVPGDTISEWQ